jgi:Spy/CpxP family protein refolding chaperone
VSSGTPGIRVALLLLVTLAAGAAGGIAVDRRLEAPAELNPETTEREGRGETTIERFADELGLTTEQRDQIAPVLENTRTRMSEVFDQVRPEYRRVVDSARAQIEAVLTPGQVEMYRTLLENENEDSTDRTAESSDRK